MTNSFTGIGIGGRSTPPKLAILIALLGGMLALLVYVPGLGTASIYLDESVLIYHGQNSDSLREYVARDANPALYPWMLHFWMSLFGISEFAVRGLSALFLACAAGLAGYHITRVAGRAAGIAGIIGQVFTQPLMNFGLEARAYGLLILLSTGMFLFALRYRMASRGLFLAGWLLCACLGLATHQLAICMIVATSCWMVFAGKPSSVAHWGGLLLPLIVWVGVVVNLTPDKLSATFWLDAPTFESFWPVWESLWGMPAWATCLFVPIAVLAIFQNGARSMAWVLLATALILAGLAIGSHYLPVFSEKYMSFWSPVIRLGLVLLMVEAFRSIPKLGAILLGVILVFQVINFEWQRPVIEDWRAAVAWVNEHQQNGDAVFTIADYHYRSFLYYHDQELFIEANRAEVMPILGKEQRFFAKAIQPEIFEFMDPNRLILLECHRKVTDPNDITGQTLANWGRNVELKYVVGIKMSIWEKE